MLTIAPLGGPKLRKWYGAQKKEAGRARPPNVGPDGPEPDKEEGKEEDASTVAGPWEGTLVADATGLTGQVTDV